jgi:hypothetical protein
VLQSADSRKCDDGRKREARDRDVPLPLPEQRFLVGRALVNADGAIDGRLFSSWTNLRRDLADACTKAGIERCSPNDLRRTYGQTRQQRAHPRPLKGAATSEPSQAVAALGDAPGTLRQGP